MRCPICEAPMGRPGICPCCGIGVPPYDAKPWPNHAMDPRRLDDYEFDSFTAMDQVRCRTDQQE